MFPATKMSELKIKIRKRKRLPEISVLKSQVHKSVFRRKNKKVDICL